MLKLGKHLKHIYYIIAFQIIFQALYSVQDDFIIEVQIKRALFSTVRDIVTIREEFGYDFHWIIYLYDPVSIVIISPITYFIIII